MSAADYDLEKLLLGLGCGGSEFVGASGINRLWGRAAGKKWQKLSSVL